MDYAAKIKQFEEFYDKLSENKKDEETRLLLDTIQSFFGVLHSQCQMIDSNIAYYQRDPW